MSNIHPEDPTTAPTAEVIVSRHGEELHRQLCESADEAAAVVAHWEEQPGVECEVVDLSVGLTGDSGEVDWDRDDGTYPGGPPDGG